MQLAHPYWLLLISLLPLSWISLRRKGYLGHSSVRLARGVSGNHILHAVPAALLSAAFVLLVVGIARPQIPHYQTTRTIKTRDIVVAVDISGSMQTPFAGKVPERQVKIPELDKELPPRPKLPSLDRYAYQYQPDTPSGQRRIDAARAAVLRFVENRYALKAGDRIGILAFDTSPHWRWPLTDDLKMIWRNGLYIDEGIGGGTNFGEAGPGPIDAAADHFEEMGKASTRVLIMVTDGEDQLDSYTLDRLAKVIKSHDIHFYVIGVGETLARQDVDIFRLTRMVGGQVYRVENAQDLSACFDSINQMEQSTVVVESKTVQQEEVFFYFAIAAGILIGLALVAETLIVSQ